MIYKNNTKCLLDGFYYCGTIDREYKDRISKFKMGVYILYNKKEDKYYVGASTNLLSRFIKHKLYHKFHKDDIGHFRIYLFQTTNNKSSLKFIEDSAMLYMLNLVSKEKLYNKVFKSSMPYKKHKPFYDFNTEFIKSLPNYEHEDKIIYDEYDAESYDSYLKLIDEKYYKY